jgi:SAM-dependent methyltransferase
MAIDLRVCTANNLPVADASVDAPISTLVLCCVLDQRESLREIMRVLKPGGRFVFIEQVAAEPGSRVEAHSEFGDADLEAVGRRVLSESGDVEGPGMRGICAASREERFPRRPYGEAQEQILARGDLKKISGC